MSYLYPDTYPDVMFAVDCDHHFLEEHVHSHDCVDTRSARLQLRHHSEPVCCRRDVAALDNLIGSWNCYGTTITIKCSQGPIGVQKAMPNVAAHHAVLDLAALVRVTCHVFGKNHSRGLAGVDPVTVISYNGLSNLQQNTWLGSR